MSVFIVISCLLPWLTTPNELPTLEVPPDLVMFGITAERVVRPGLKRNLFSNRIWVWENGEWQHPWSFQDSESGTRWNLFVAIDRVVAHERKIVFTGLVNHVNEVKFGLFLYEPGKEIRPLLLYDMSGFLKVNLSLPEPYRSLVAAAYEKELADWQESPSEHKRVYNRVFSRTLFKKRQELSPVGWLADGKTLLLWRPKKLLFVPLDGEPPRLVELKDLRSQVPDWEGDGFRVAFGNRPGAKPVLANNRKLYQIQNDGSLVPWHQRAEQPELGIVPHQGADTSSLAEAAPERLEMLFGGAYFHWENLILDQHLKTLWDLGNAKHVVQVAREEPVIAVAHYSKRRIEVRHMTALKQPQVFKFKAEILDMALNDQGDVMAVALFGKQKRKYINDITLIDLKTGEQKPLGLNFLPYLQSLNEKMGDEASRMAFSDFFLEKDFKKHGFFPKLFALGDHFYFKVGNDLAAVDRDGVIKQTGITVNPYLLWDAFSNGRSLFPDYRRFMQIPEKPGPSIGITVSF